MRKAIFIIPYFGKFNNYFQLFLNSCKYNKDYDWLIFTDDKTKFEYPKNVTIKYISFKEMREYILSKFNDIEKIRLERPYKLCDYKPMYGYIFDKYISNYDYWGFCDIDLIFGKINQFIDLEKLKDFDRIGFLGHFSLFKNTEEINTMFMRTSQFRNVLESDKSFKFDEEFSKSINNILLDRNKKIFEKEYYADIYVKSSNFKITHYDINKNNYNVDKKDKSFFVWQQGNLYKIKKCGDKYQKKEYLYIHLQKRKMKVKNIDNENYKIIPNSFEDLEKDFYNSNYKKIKRKNFNLHYFYIRGKNLKKKLLDKIKGE